MVTVTAQSGLTTGVAYGMGFDGTVDVDTRSSLSSE
jgi:hypothetical protein